MLREQMTLPRGFTIRDPSGNRYIIEGVLGKGGFSAVYLVRERSNRQNVFALKEIIDPNRRERERFIFEWEVLKRLNHPALPQVYQVFEHQKLRRVYILMHYIEGRDLEWLRVEQPDKRFSVPLVLTLMHPIVEAVNYLHDQDPPVVHRDIKPANIIVPLDGDEAVLVDFSIAKEYVPNSTTTAARHGSPGYAAPEQYGTGTTPLTDVYGLGATLYTLLTGATPTDALTRLTSGKIDPLQAIHERVPTIPRGISEAVQRAMSLNREERFATIAEFWQEIQATTDEKQASSTEITHLHTGQLPNTRLRPLEDITTTFIDKRNNIPLVRQRRTPLVLLILLFTVTFVAGVLYYRFYYGPRAIHPIVSRTGVVVHSHATSTATTVISPYPLLVKNYTGTVSDMANSSKTALQLSNIQEMQNNISGSFQGLGLTGPFKGTIDTFGHIHFTIVIYGGDTILVFDGVIKLGGAMAGNFAVQSQNGQSTGEYGIWSASPA